MDSETMISSAEVLLKKAKNLEVQGLEKNKIALGSASILDQMLNEVYISRSPKQIDYDNRRDLVRIFNVMVKEIYGNCNGFPIVEGFGSFVMGMFSAESDLDLSINFMNNAAEIPRVKKIQTLHKLAKKLYSIQRGGHVSSIQTIMTARVPIVKVIDRGTRIECDVSVQNRDGIVKSLIICAISTIDERFQKLSFLVKAWAKAHDINSSKERTLNSLSLISLVAFHLQTRDPPILPPFSALLKDGSDPEAVMKMVQNYLNYGERNTESLAELFVTLLVKLASVEKLWQKGLCVGLCEGFWIAKAWDSGICSLSVEDFTDKSQNVARAVRTEGFEKIHSCIRHSLQYLGAFSEGQMKGTKLKELLFGRDTNCNIGDSVAINLDKSTTKPFVPNNSKQRNKMQITKDLKGAENQSMAQLVQHESHQTKKRRFTEGLDKSKGEKRWKGAQLLDRNVGVQLTEVGKEHVQNLVQPLPRKGAQLLDRNVGVQLTEVGKEHVENLVQPLPTIGWEGKHPVDSRVEWQNFGENRGHLTTHFPPQVPYLVSLSYSLDSSPYHGPVMLPSISVPNFTSFQGLYNPIPPPPPHTLLSSLGLNVSHIQNLPAPMPRSGPIQWQHAQHQPHSVQRILRR